MGCCKKILCCLPRTCKRILCCRPNLTLAASVAIFWNITVLAAGVVNVIFDQTKDAFGDEEAWQAGIISQICIASVGLLGSLVARCCVSQHVGFATPRERLLLAVLCTSATFAGYGAWCGLSIAWTVDAVDSIEWCAAPSRCSCPRSPLTHAI